MKHYLQPSLILFCTLLNHSFAETRTGKLTFVEPSIGSIEIDFSLLVNNAEYSASISASGAQGGLPKAEVADLKISGAFDTFPRLTSPYSIRELEALEGLSILNGELISQKRYKIKPIELPEIDLREDHVAYKILTSEGNSAYLIRNGTYIGGYNRYYCTWFYETTSSTTRLAQPNKSPKHFEVETKGNNFQNPTEVLPVYSLRGERLQKNFKPRFLFARPAH